MAQLLRKALSTEVPPTCPAEPRVSAGTSVAAPHANHSIYIYMCVYIVYIYIYICAFLFMCKNMHIYIYVLPIPRVFVYEVMQDVCHKPHRSPHEISA